MKNYSVDYLYYTIYGYKLFHFFTIISAGLGWFQARNDEDLTKWTF